MTQTSRAKVKIVTAFVALVLFVIVMDLHRLAGDDLVMRSARITTWVGSLALAPWISLRMSALYRLYGVLLGGVSMVGLLFTAFGLAQGWPEFWRPLSVAVVAGVAAYVFLFDREVRQFRSRATGV